VLPVVTEQPMPFRHIVGVVVGRATKTFVARAWINGKNGRVKIGIAGQPRPDGHLWSVALARVEARKLLGKMADGADPNAELRAERASTAAPAGGRRFATRTRRTWRRCASAVAPSRRSPR
jgi:hypothetical protein